MDRRRQESALTLLALSLVLALGSMGMAYAAWTDQLAQAVTVHTGSLSVRWVPAPVCSDSDGAPGIAQVSAAVDPADDHLAHFAVTNAYPGYSADCAGFKFTNSGTVPVTVQYLDVNGTPVPSSTPTDLDLDHDGVPDLQIAIWDNVGSTFPPGRGASEELTVTVLPGAPENTALNFTAHVNFVLATGP